jgi:ribosomal RNA-processing protein 8
MFSVPGWNVTAPVKAQVAAPKPKDPNKVGKKALKRKQKQEEQINAENLVEHWDKVASGNASKPQEKPQAEAITSEVNGVEAAGDGVQEKRGKKRKRGKAGGNKNKQDNGDAAAKTDEAGAVEPEAAADKSTAAADGESKRDKKKRKKDQKADSANATTAVETPIPAAAVNLIPEPKGLTPLQRSMRSKLASARFRHLNESLYTKPSKESLDLFKEDPSMFEDYHRGFAQQVEVWPSNPVDGYVASILARGKFRTKDPWKDKKRQAKKGNTEFTEPESAVVPARGDAKPLPRNMNGHCTIADLGCGTASLSYRLQPHLKHLNLTFHSFDLSKPSGPSAPLVTVADISALPLKDNSVDIAIFCLALMGTNWLDFIDEAYRVLRWRGELWISEIKSRFGRPKSSSSGNITQRKIPINSIGSLKKALPPKKTKKDEEETTEADDAELSVAVDGNPAQETTDVSAFIEVLRKRGFVLDALPERQNDAIDLSNKMFVKMQFVKAAHPSKGKNAKEDQKAGAGRPQMKFGLKGKRVGALKDKEEEGDEVDGRVLKPCLYKIR